MTKDYTYVPQKTALLPDHAKFELDGEPTTLERLQSFGVMPNEIVRVNKRIYMNGQLLNLTGPSWESLSIPVLPGPTVSDGISKPVIIASDSFKLDELEVPVFTTEVMVEL